MWKAAVPNEMLEQLRCSLCKEYLSQTPVYSYSDQGVGCGRCPILSDQNPVRNLCYEAVVKFLFFPCRFKMHGCLATLLPSHVQAHEESCYYKQYFCPFIPLASCPWQGPRNELFDHYKEQHQVLALQNSSFEVDLVNMYENNYLLEHGEDLFVIHVKCEVKENTFWCGVRYVGNKNKAKKYSFQIELCRPNGIEKLKLSKQEVGFDTSMNLDKEAALHVDTDHIRKALSNPCSIICKIYMYYNENTDSSPIKNLNGVENLCTTIDGIVDEQLLREFECPVCNEYMVPPIYQCVAGHTICDNCRTKVPSCPTCECAIQDTRNFSLEQMTRLNKYCCKYKPFNCTFVTTSEKIRSHEAECRFGPYTCPFKDYDDCKWKGALSSLMDHSHERHGDNVLEVEVVTWPWQEDWSEEDDEDCFLIKAYDDIFKLLFKYDVAEGVFNWTVQLVGPAEDAVKYMFEIDIIDNSESMQRLFVRRNCNLLTEKDDAFKPDAAFIQLSVEMLSPLMNGNDLIYKCHIVKK